MMVRGRTHLARGAKLTLPAAGLAIAALLLLPGRASAHTNFIGSDPPDSAALNSSPRTVTLDFDKKVNVSLATIAVVDADGRSHPPTSVSVGADRNTELIVGLPVLPRDTYRLSYVVRDSVDLHILTGSVVFGVGSAPTLSSQAPTTAQTASVEVALRWLNLFGLCLVTGAVLMCTVLRKRVDEQSGAGVLRRQLLVVGVAGVALELDAQVFVLVSQLVDLGNASDLRTLLTQSDFGLRWMLGMALTLCLLGVLLIGLRSRSRTLTPPFWPRARRLLRMDIVAAVLVIASGLVEGVSGHSGDDASPTIAGTLVRGAHIVSVSAWMGGLCLLVFVAVQARRLGPSVVAPGTTRAIAAGFSPWAGSLFAVIAVTGLLLAGVQVASVTALLSTAYGAALIVKVCLVALVAVLALRHTLLLRSGKSRSDRAPWWHRVRLSLPAEAAVAALVLLIASFLAASPPPRGPEYQPASEAAPSAVAVTARDLVVRVEMRPNRPGRNLLTVAVLNTRRPIPGPVRGVTVQLRQPGAAAAKQVATAPTLQAETYDGGAVDLHGAGELGINVVVSREGLPVLTTAVPWRVNPNQAPAHPTVVSAQSLAPMTNTAAVLLALVAGLLLWRRRRSRVDSRPSVAAQPESRSLATSAPRAPTWELTPGDEGREAASADQVMALSGPNVRD